MSQKTNKKLYTYIILVMAVLLTKVLGLVRGILLSSFYGTGIEASAFTAVSNLPLILFDVTFGTAISSAFVPVFNEKLSKENKDSANKFASNFITIVLLISFVLVGIGITLPKFAVMLVASGFNSNAQTMALATQLMQIVMPIMSIACATFIFIGILQSYGEFIAPALVSLFSNISMILYFLCLDKKFGIKGLAVAFVFGWFLQFLFLVPFLIKKKFRFSFIVNFKSPDIKKVVILTLPLFVAALAQPVNQLISSNISSSVSSTGVATVNYAYNAYYIVAGVFSYALTNMFFPEMSRRFAVGDTDGATKICSDMLSNITAIIMPVMAVMGSCSYNIIKILYERGKFTAADTQNVSMLLCVYVFGMLFISWQDILNKFFYSMQKSVIPMICASVGIGVNLVCSFLLTKFFGIAGLAISTVIAGGIMTVMLCVFAQKTVGGVFNKKMFIEILKVVLSGAVAFAACKFSKTIFDFGNSFISQIIVVVIAFLLSCALYVLSLVFLKSNNIKALLKRGSR